MKIKKVRVCAMALLLAALLPLSAMAKTWDDVDTSDKMTAAFADTDADVVINLTSDTTAPTSLEAKAGQTYTINGQGHILSNLVLCGDGTVNVNADLKGDSSNAALRTSGNVIVNLSGDVTGDRESLYAEGESKVKVTGNVDGYCGITAFDDSSINVTGNVTGSEYAVVTDDNADVIITGDVIGTHYDDSHAGINFTIGGNGVYSRGESTVTVNGNVTGGDANGTYGTGGYGVWSRDYASISVTGDVNGGSITADPNVANPPLGRGCGAMGAIMNNTANLTIGGNVLGGTSDVSGGCAGNGIVIQLNTNADVQGKLYVAGAISGGSALSDNTNKASGLAYRRLDKTVTQQIIPQVTVWGINGGNNADAVDLDNGDLPAQALIAEHNYIVRVAAAVGGKVLADKETAKPGETVTITATPDTGYNLDSVKLNGVALIAQNGVYSFTMPDFGGVEISAEFKAQAAPAPVPKTGDTCNMSLFIIMAAMSLCSIGAMKLKSKKSEKSAHSNII